MGNSNISIDTKDYDEACFGIRVFDENLGHGDINDLVAEISINDEICKINSKEDIALTDALMKLIENHNQELVDLYNSEIKKRESGYYN